MRIEINLEFVFISFQSRVLKDAKNGRAEDGDGFRPNLQCAGRTRQEYGRESVSVPESSVQHKQLLQLSYIYTTVSCTQMNGFHLSHICTHACGYITDAKLNRHYFELPGSAELRPSTSTASAEQRKLRRLLSAKV